MSFEVHTNEPHEGRRILLLDLVWTFAYRPEGAKPASGEAYVRQIRDEEQYRSFIVDHFLDKGWYIILFTARRGKYREVSLESIQRKIGWRPGLLLLQRSRPRASYLQADCPCAIRLSPLWDRDLPLSGPRIQQINSCHVSEDGD